ASSPLATCTSHSAPTSLQRCSTEALSRCQRSSFSVSIEKPMRTGPLPRTFLPPPSGPFTQAVKESADSSKGISLLVHFMVFVLPSGSDHWCSHRTFIAAGLTPPHNSDERWTLPALKRNSCRMVTP